MTFFRDLIDNLINILFSMKITDVIDILILSYLIYKTYKLVRETRAQQLVKGILIILGGYLVATTVGLKTMTFLLDNFFQWGVVALIVMFQPELRRILEKMGRTKVSKFNVFAFGSEIEGQEGQAWDHAIDAICEASKELSSTLTGALIVLERQTRLGEQIDTGTRLDAVPSVQLFGNIFFSNTPLHDGAVIMRDGVILAAGCFLPKPQKEELINKQLGSRHRAAIGMSENSDALVIAISEETGTISVAEDGELTRGFNKESLKKYLISKLLPEEKVDNKKDKLFFLGKNKKDDKTKG